MSSIYSPLQFAQVFRILTIVHVVYLSVPGICLPLNALDHQIIRNTSIVYTLVSITWVNLCPCIWLIDFELQSFANTIWCLFIKYFMSYAVNKINCGKLKFKSKVKPFVSSQRRPTFGGRPVRRMFIAEYSLNKRILGSGKALGQSAVTQKVCETVW